MEPAKCKISSHLPLSCMLANGEHIYVRLTVGRSRQPGFRVFPCPKDAHGANVNSSWVCCRDFLEFRVDIHWMQHLDSLEEIHANIQIEGTVLYSIVLQKRESVAKGLCKQWTKHHKVTHFKLPGMKKGRKFVAPPVRPVGASNESDAGVIAVELFTATGDKLAKFRYERQTEDYIRSKGHTFEPLLTKERHHAQRRLKGLLAKRDAINKQIKDVEAVCDVLQQQVDSEKMKTECPGEAPLDQVAGVTASTAAHDRSMADVLENLKDASQVAEERKAQGEQAVAGIAGHDAMSMEQD